MYTLPWLSFTRTGAFDRNVSTPAPTDRSIDDPKVGVVALNVASPAGAASCMASTGESTLASQEAAGAPTTEAEPRLGLGIEYETGTAVVRAGLSLKNQPDPTEAVQTPGGATTEPPMLIPATGIENVARQADGLTICPETGSGGTAENVAIAGNPTTVRPRPGATELAVQTAAGGDKARRGVGATIENVVSAAFGIIVRPSPGATELYVATAGVEMTRSPSPGATELNVTTPTGAAIVKPVPVWMIGLTLLNVAVAGGVVTEPPRVTTGATELAVQTPGGAVTPTVICGETEENVDSATGEMTRAVPLTAGATEENVATAGGLIVKFVKVTAGAIDENVAVAGGLVTLPPLSSV